MSVAAVKMKDDLDWSEEEKGLVLVCFNIRLPIPQDLTQVYFELVCLLLGVRVRSDAGITLCGRLWGKANIRPEHCNPFSINAARATGLQTFLWHGSAYSRTDRFLRECELSRIVSLFPYLDPYRREDVNDPIHCLWSLFGRDHWVFHIRRFGRVDPVYQRRLLWRLAVDILRVWFAGAGLVPSVAVCGM
jgi:hypothetical protein